MVFYQGQTWLETEEETEGSQRTERDREEEIECEEEEKGGRNKEQRRDYGNERKVGRLERRE